jgi:predicted RNase H-like HicB family nuclease
MLLKRFVRIKDKTYTILISQVDNDDDDGEVTYMAEAWKLPYIVSFGNTPEEAFTIIRGLLIDFLTGYESD